MVISVTNQASSNNGVGTEPLDLILMRVLSGRATQVEDNIRIIADQLQAQNDRASQAKDALGELVAYQETNKATGYVVDAPTWTSAPNSSGKTITLDGGATVAIVNANGGATTLITDGNGNTFKVVGTVSASTATPPNVVSFTLSYKAAGAGDYTTVATSATPPAGTATLADGNITFALDNGTKITVSGGGATAATTTTSLTITRGNQSLVAKGITSSAATINSAVVVGAADLTGFTTDSNTADGRVFRNTTQQTLPADIKEFNAGALAGYAPLSDSTIQFLKDNGYVYPAGAGGWYSSIQTGQMKGNSENIIQQSITIGQSLYLQLQLYLTKYNESYSAATSTLKGQSDNREGIVRNIGQ